MTIESRLSALAARPATHNVETRYACGKVRTYGARSAAAAENYAVGERRKIGRALIDRETGNPVQVVAVEIIEI